MNTPAETNEGGLNLKTICNELAIVALKYFKIGLFLNVPFHKLKEFEKDEHPLPCVINYLLTNGISEDCSPLSWQSIVEALESKSVSEPGLARSIAKKYCRSEENEDILKCIQTPSKPVAPSVISSQTSSGESSYIPPAVDLASYFPYLSKEERTNSYYLQKLIDETDEIKRKFDCLVFDLLQDLKKSTTLENVVTLLVFNWHDLEKVLKDCIDLNEVLKQLSKFISFFDYGPVKLLAYKFASESFKKKLKKYKKKFQEYAKRRICECPCDAFESLDIHEKGYVLKTEKDISTVTFEEIAKLEYEMNKILGHTCLHLVNVKEGCVELIFRTLNDIELRISEDQKMNMKKLKILSIGYGEELVQIQTADVFKENFKDEEMPASSDSGIHTRGTILTSGKLSECTDSSIDRNTNNTISAFNKEKDLKDLRLDMITAAESKPQKLPHTSPLHQAIRTRNLQKVKRLIKTKENPMAKDINGNSCLHYAAEMCQFEILKYLIEEVQCPPGTEGWNGNTILHIATQTGLLCMVQYLVESEHCKLDPATENNHGHSALHAACSSGDVKITHYLIESMSEYMKIDDMLYDVVSPNQSNSETEITVHDYISSPLSCACWNGNLSVVKYLVEDRQCNPLILQGSKKKAPIESAVIGNHLDIVKYIAAMPGFQIPSSEPSLVFLATENANLKMIKYLTQVLHCDFNKDYKGRSPLHEACLCGRLDLLKYFLTKLNCNPSTKGCYGFQPIHFASYGGQVHIVKYIFENTTCSTTSETDDGQTPLYLASKYGHITLVRYLTSEQHCNPLSACKSLGNSLHATAIGGHIDVACYFVKGMKCNRNSRNLVSHRTPLHVAADHGHLEYVKWLIEELGCDASSKDRNGRTPLQGAMGHGMISVVKYLIEKQRCDIFSTDNQGWGIAHFAANAGELGILKYLFEEQKLDKTVPNTIEGFTPLCLAAACGHLSVVRYLLDIGSQHYNPASQTPLSIAAKYGHIEIVKYIMNSPSLRSMYSDNFPVIQATSEGHLDIVKYFIKENHCDPCFVSCHGHNLLHYAAEFGHIEVVKYLTSLTTKIEHLATDDNNMTPLRLAVKHGHLEVIKWLVNLNKPNSANFDEYLQAATYFGHLHVVRYLVDNLKCDPTTPSNSSIIYLAVQSGELDMIKYFGVKKKCNPSIICEGKMPIHVHVAAVNGKIDVVRCLVNELKCDPMSKGERQSVPLHCAAASGQLEMVKYLVEELSCDPCSGDEWNSTPLMAAATMGHFHIVHYLICEKKVPFTISIHEEALPSP